MYSAKNINNMMMLTESMLLLRLKPHTRKLQSFTNQHVTKQEAEQLMLHLKQFFFLRNEIKFYTTLKSQYTN